MTQDKRGFTLIELLVVVAIIGILAAVGVVAYNGYTSAAKVSVVKANYAMIKNYILSEKFKCESGADMAFENSFSCSGNSFKDGRTLASRVEAHFKDKIKNPYGGFNVTYAGGYDADTEVGIITIYGWDTPERVALFVCIKTPCNDIQNRLSTTIQLD